MAPSCVVDAGACPVVRPSDLAAMPNSPIALYCAVIGMLIVPIAPSWSRPTEVVEQLLAALAKRPIDSEHKLIGASRLRSGDFWVVVFVPVRAFCPGSKLLPISFASAVIGTDIEIGRPPSDGDGAWAVDALGVDVTGAGAAGLTAGAGADAGAGAFGTVVVGVVIFGTVTVVGVVDAPIGPMPVNTV